MAVNEDLWGRFDKVWSWFTPAQWSRKYGKDRTFADQPYHMAFFDRVMVAEPLVKGPSIPKQERWLLRSGTEINGWNAKEFAKRPAGMTPQQALADYRAGHDALRKAVAGMTDADLDKKVWMPLVFGWVTMRDAVGTAALHGIGEYTELWLRPQEEGARTAA